MKEKQRNSSVELLRIVATLMVVVSHCSFHGFYHEGEGYMWIRSAWNRFFLQVANMGSLGVDVFVLIMGYYMVHTKRVGGRIKDLLGEVWTYSMISLGLCAAYGNNTITAKTVLTSVFPTMFGRYWFFTTYVVLYVFSPFLNRGLHSLKNDTNAFRKVVGMMFLLWSVSPTLTTAAWGSESNLVQFVMLYTMGAYLALFPECWLIHKADKALLITVVAWLGTSSLGDVVGIRIPYVAQHITYFYSKNSVLTICFALSLVAFTVKRNFVNEKINALSKGAFAVYLLTDNSLLRQLLWTELLHVEQRAESPILIIWFVIWGVSLFFVGIALDAIRRRTIARWLSVGDVYIEKKLKCVWNRLKVRYSCNH